MVIVDIDNDYCGELLHSYQLCFDEDSQTYYVYRETGLFKGVYEGKGFATFAEAWVCLMKSVAVNESVEV